MSRRESFLSFDNWLAKYSDDEPDSRIYDQDFVSDVARRRAQQVCPKREETIRYVADICTKIGLSPEDLEERLDGIEDGVAEYWSDIRKAAQMEFDKLCQYKEDLLKQVQSMMKDLYDQEYSLDGDLTFLQHCKRLKAKFEKLNNIKQERLNKFKELRSMQLSHCSVLGIRPPHASCKSDIPSEKELEELADIVMKLKRKEEQQKAKYAELKKNICNCMEELEYEPETDFERNILTEKPNYSDSHLLEMSQLQDKLKEQYSINAKKFERLKSRLISLLDRLEVDQEEREILQEFSICKPSVMARMEDEIERYEELKKQNIGKFISKIKVELAEEYQRCFIPMEKQDDFEFYALSTASGECNEQLLELYEKELQRIKNYYQDNRELFEKFNKWRIMWKDLIELELRANDPSRFNNRGGQLLTEERKRKGLQKGLPKVEQELKALNKEYASNNEGVQFKIEGTDLEEYIDGCWEELEKTKEIQKLERQRAKMTVTNPPNVRKPLQTQAQTKKTPVKRAAGAGITPTPTKLQKSYMGTPSNITYRLNPAFSGSCQKSTQKNSLQAHNKVSTASVCSAKSNIPVAYGVSQRQKPASNTDGSDYSTLSLSEREFEDLIVTRPASAKRTRF